MENDIKLIQNYKEQINLQVLLSLYEKSLKNKKISYIPYLVNINNVTNVSLQEGMTVEEANNILKQLQQPLIKDQNINMNFLKSLSTLEILKYTDNLYKTKITNDEIKAIANELKKRNDIFDVTVQYTNDIKKFYNELHFWYPHLEISDTLTLILSIFDENTLIEKYKNYLKEHLILDKSYSEGLFAILKERFCSTLFSHINIMKSDLSVFACKRNRKVTKKIVSHSFWCDKTYKCSKNLVNKLIKEKYIIDKHVDEDIIYEFCGCLSYVEFTVCGKQEISITAPTEYLDDLINGCKKYQEYWINIGVVDKNGKHIL